jgi:hypothetical protein
VPHRDPLDVVLALGPANVFTSASIIAVMTCKPAPTAKASRPSRMSAATSAITTFTCSGTAISGESILLFW